MRKALVTLALLLALCGSARAQDTSPIVAEGVIDAPVEAVWAAWTTSEGLRSWLAPHAEIDLRVGGLMRTNYNAQGALGDPQTIENRVLAFDPRRMLSIQVAKTPEKFPFPNAVHQMWTVLYVEATAASQTRIRVVGLGFGLEEESQKMRAFFQKGNATTVEQLRRHFARPRSRKYHHEGTTTRRTPRRHATRRHDDRRSMTDDTTTR